jgi:hypothetical protein
VFTATGYDFDFQIPLSTPFYYDPSQGNLLLDLTVLSASGESSVAGFLFNADGIGSNMGTLWSSGDSVITTPHLGFVTQFTVPEPSVLSFISFAVVLWFVFTSVFGAAKTKPRA